MSSMPRIVKDQGVVLRGEADRNVSSFFATYRPDIGLEKTFATYPLALTVTERWALVTFGA